MDKKELVEFLRREKELGDLAAVMDLPEGRRFVWRLLGDLGIFRPSFVAGSPDTTAFNEGSRNAGLALLGEIMTNLPGSYLIMQKEAVDEQEKRNKEARRHSRRAKAHRDTGGGNSHDGGNGE